LVATARGSLTRKIGLQGGAKADEALEVTDKAHLDPQALGQVVATLLSNHPEAPLAAIDGAGNFVRMPASVPLLGRPVIGAYSAFDLVTGSDRAAVLEAWQRARAKGAARANVHLADGPGRLGVLQFVDARKQYGVYLGMLLAQSNDSPGSAGADRAAEPAFRPRISVVQRDELGFVIGIDDATTAMLGWTLEELIGQRALDFIHPEDNERALRNWMEMLARPGSRSRWRGRHIRRDGSWLWLEVTNHNQLEGVVGGHVSSEMLDISCEMAMQEALRAQEQLLHRLSDSLPVGVLQFDRDGRVAYANELLYQMLGTGPQVRVHEQFCQVLAEDGVVLARAIKAVLDHDVDRDVDLRLQSEPGTPPRHCAVKLRALTDESGQVTGAIATVANVPDRDQLPDDLDRARHARAARNAVFGDGRSAAL
jgi:PAS domain S-box-containing protein